MVSRFPSLPFFGKRLSHSSLFPAPHIRSGSDTPNCCAAVLRYIPFSTGRSCAWHRTDFETSSGSNTLLATVHGSFRRARSASACPAECELTRSVAPHTRPGNADSSVPAHCRNESPRVARARPRSHPTRASLSDWQSSCPLPRPNIRACTHPSRSAPGSFARSPPHRVQNPTPTPGSPLSTLARAVPRERSVSASSAGSPIPPPDTRDARVCGSHALPSGLATHATADTRSAASLALTPPAAFVAVHPCASSGSGNSKPLSSASHTLAAG